IAGEVGESLVFEVAQQQLAHGAHDEEEHEADDHVNEDDRWAGDRDGLARAHEQAGADSAANGDQLDMTIGESALESGIGTCGTHAGCLPGLWRDAPKVSCLQAWLAWG